MATYTVKHGTFERFNRFDASFLGKNTDENATDESLAQTAHLGFWFNEGGDLSEVYDIEMECEIELENPMEGGSLDTLAYWVESQDMTGEELREMLIEQGYDGIMIEDEEFGGTSYIVFDHENIKIL